MSTSKTWPVAITFHKVEWLTPLCGMLLPFSENLISVAWYCGCGTSHKPPTRIRMFPTSFTVWAQSLSRLGVLFFPAVELAQQRILTRHSKCLVDVNCQHDTISSPWEVSSAKHYLIATMSLAKSPDTDGIFLLEHNQAWAYHTPWILTSVVGNTNLSSQYRSLVLLILVLLMVG